MRVLNSHVLNAMSMMCIVYDIPRASRLVIITSFCTLANAFIAFILMCYNEKMFLYALFAVNMFCYIHTMNNAHAMFTNVRGECQDFARLEVLF